MPSFRSLRLRFVSGRLLVAGLLALSFTLSLGASRNTAGAADSLNALDAAEREQPAFHRYLLNEVAAAEQARRDRYEAAKTPEELAAYQQRIRTFFLAQLGELPERTPLNARVVDTIPRDGYTVEKVIYESIPGVFVTALFYRPDGAPPFPGVLVPCGHSSNGKASEPYQRVCILLAKNGIAALCYDPIDQGERLQLFDAEGNPAPGNVKGHCRFGVGAILVGQNTATYRIWDGLRSMDYLASRDEVDPTRLGCTGNSGGGTMTSYLMALDDRIVCAAPSCYLTTLPTVIRTINPQDAEQNIFGQLAFGMDHAEYVIARAPKPTLICCATRDFFDIHGTWETFRDAKRFYTRLGFAERVDLIETDATHGFSLELRTGAVRWMRRWLLKIDDAIVEHESPILTDEQCLCTPSGQVLKLPGARSIYEVTAALAEKYRKARNEKYAGESPEAFRRRVLRFAGIRYGKALPPAEGKLVRSIRREDYRIEVWRVAADESLPLPMVAMIPDHPDGSVLLSLPPEGKNAAASTNDVLQAVKSGTIVVLFDLPGIGELESRDTRRYAPDLGPELNDATILYLLGRSLLALRAECTLQIAEFLRKQCPAWTEKFGGKLKLTAAEGTAPPALHAAIASPELFSQLEVRRMVRSWEDVVRTPTARNQYANVIHGVLREYDLPELVSQTAELLPVSVSEPVDPQGSPLADR
ncbi:alpha/beta hydrolase family protein [Thermostilla marina]